MKAVKAQQLVQPSRARRHAYLLCIPFVGAVLSIAAYPLKVTVDGYFYLSSARSIWTSLDSTHYYWIREPAYPIFLRMIHVLLGDSDVSISVLQSLLMSIPIAALIAFVAPNPSRAEKIVACMIGLYSLSVAHYFGYSSMVLKQPLIIFMVFLGALAVHLAFRVERARSVIVLLVALILGALLSPHVSVTLKYTWLWPSLLVPVVLAMRRRRLVSARMMQYGVATSRRGLVLGLLAASFFTVVSFGAGQLSEAIWDRYKERNSSGTMLATDFELDESDVLWRRLTRPDLIARGIIEEVPILLMITPTDNPSGLMENVVYTKWQADESFRCGAYDEFSYMPYTEFGRYVQPTCRSGIMQSLIRRLLGVNEDFYRVVMVASLIVPVLVLVARRLRATAILSMGPWFAFTYAANSGFTVDRYGLPLFPFGVAAIVLAALTTFRTVKKIKVSAAA